ncbi:MAG: hypothetical protein K0S31_3042 [Sphingobacterium multivorum]|jgi:TonB family protein|nr:hypothetical protein [Sphingobacterium multivorum]
MKLLGTLCFLALSISLYGQNNPARPKEGDEQFAAKLNKQLKLSNSEIQRDISGEVVLDFRVNEHGKIDSIDIVRDLGDKISHRLIDILKRSGDWEPAKKNGSPVASWVRFPYKVLSLRESASSSLLVKAEPIEGMSTFIEKFYKNFQYPPEALKAGLSGDYELNFIVKEDGKITGVKLKDDPGYGVLTSAQRALNRAGKWKPATQNGEAVKSSVVVPFKLNLKEFRTHI